MSLSFRAFDISFMAHKSGTQVDSCSDFSSMFSNRTSSFGSSNFSLSNLLLSGYFSWTFCDILRKTKMVDRFTYRMTALLSLLLKSFFSSLSLAWKSVKVYSNSVSQNPRINPSENFVKLRWRLKWHIPHRGWMPLVWVPADQAMVLPWTVPSTDGPH